MRLCTTLSRLLHTLSTQLNSVHLYHPKTASVQKSTLKGSATIYLVYTVNLNALYTVKWCIREPRQHV